MSDRRSRRWELDEWREVGFQDTRDIEGSTAWKVLGGLLMLGWVGVIVLAAVWLAHTFGSIWFVLMGAPR